MRFRFAANAWLRRVLIKSRLVTATWSMSALAHFADSSRTSPEVREVPILLQNSAIGGARQDGRKFLKGRVRRSAAIGRISSIGRLARQRLGGTRGGRRRGSCDKFGKPAEGLCGRCQGELVLRAKRAAQSKAAEPENALEGGEQHLDPLSVVARLLQGRGFAEPPRRLRG